MPEVSDLLNTVVNKEPLEFSNVFDDLIRSKIATAVEDKKLEIAHNVFGTQVRDVE